MKLSIVLSLALALIAVSVLAVGLTGMSTVDLGRDYCDSGNDCMETCCLFYNSNYGVCDRESNCNSIKLLSMEQGITTAKNPDLPNQMPAFISSNLTFKNKVSFLNSAIASGLLFIISLFVLVIGNRRGI